MFKTIRKVLVIKLRDIGDIVLSTPALNTIYENTNYPGIIYVVKKGYGNFKYLLPNVKEVIEYDRKSVFSFFSLIFKLRKHKFDLAVNFHASFRSALIVLFSGAKFRLVHNHSGKDYFSSVPLNIEEKPKKNTLRDLDTLAPLKMKTTPETLKTRLVLKDEISLLLDFDEVEGAVGFGIGAKRREKIWDKEKFIRLGRKFAEAGDTVIICCIEKEKKEGKEIAQAIGENARLYISHFLHFAHYISRMKVFVGNDSALIHIAAAAGTRTVALFGPENPEEWHPYEEKDGHIAVSHLKEMEKEGIDILDRRFREKSREPMDRITVDEVYEAAKKLTEEKEV
ncbi:MAG: glycosyltransferase family 9 protein [Candidatus Goldiibacteriota bacterium]